MRRSLAGLTARARDRFQLSREITASAVHRHKAPDNPQAVVRVRELDAPRGAAVLRRTRLNLLKMSECEALRERKQQFQSVKHFVKADSQTSALAHNMDLFCETGSSLRGVCEA